MLDTTTQRHEQLSPVTPAAPCGVCGGGHKCSTGDGGLILCGRRDGPEPGFVHLGPAAGDPEFNLYRQAGLPRRKQRPKRRPKGRSAARQSPTPDWPARARTYAAAFGTRERAALAQALGLPETVFSAIPLLGWDANRSAWAFPEYDGDVGVVGLLFRGTDGKKRAARGGTRGLSVVGGWSDRPGTVLLVEGPSDALALTAAGLPAVGRPSNSGGVEYLAALLSRLTPGREVLVVGENDGKTDGSWPGRDGAARTAEALGGRLGRPVGFSLPPDGAKDVRDWLTGRVAAGAGWAAAGGELRDHLSAAAQHPAAAAHPAAAGGRPTIRVTTDEHDVNDQAVAALAREPDLFQRGKQLVRATVVPPPKDAAVRRPAGLRIDAIGLPTLRERLARAALWELERTKDDAVEVVPARPPAWCVTAVHARGSWPDVRFLDAVVEYPVLLTDGSLLTTPGYHNGLLYCPPPGLEVVVPDRPTEEDARAAAGRLTELVTDFPFAAPVHRSAWLAALLTPLARFGHKGPAPLFLIDANVPAAGKGLLCDLIATVVTGQRLGVTTYTNDVEEFRKRVTSIAAQGERLVLFDNVDGPFGNAALDALLTADEWSDRLLGGNVLASFPLVTTWLATGNNVQVTGDTVRRVAHVKLESPLERPEERTGFRHPDLLAHARENRAGFLADALTILRGWHAAGRPDAGLPAWGSYAGWSGVVRNAVAFCGLPDPAAARGELRARADPLGDAMAALLRGISEIDPHRRGVTASDIIVNYHTQPYPPPAWHRDFKSALHVLLPKVEPQPLGYKLRSCRRRLYGGFFLDAVGGGGRSESGNLWAAFPADQFQKDATPRPSER